MESTDFYAALSTMIMCIIFCRNFPGGSRVIQCRFEIPMNGCNKLYYRYTISFVPEMLSTTGVYELHEIKDCYRVLCFPPSRGNCLL